LRPAFYRPFVSAWPYTIDDRDPGVRHVTGILEMLMRAL